MYFDHADPVTKRLISAVREKDVDRIRTALRTGADVDVIGTICEKPYWSQMLDFLDIDMSSHDPEMYRDEKPVNREIAKLLVMAARNVSGLKPDLTFGPRSWFYKAFELKTLSEVSEILLLKAICETKGAARINLDRIFSGLGSEPYHKIRLEYKNRILSVHERVRQRLLNPRDEIDTQALDSLTGIHKSYWAEPLPFPDLAQLSCPGFRSVRKPPLQPEPLPVIARTAGVSHGSGFFAAAKVVVGLVKCVRNLGRTRSIQAPRRDR